MAKWSRGMILASGARGPGFKSRLGPFYGALCNRGAIIFLPCSFFPSFFYLLFFPRLISAAVDRMSAILLHMAWPYSANLECRSEMCCTRLAANTGRTRNPAIAEGPRDAGVPVEIW